jgi:hypothetical protein
MKTSSRSHNVHRFTAVLEKSTNKLWGCHFRVPNPIAQKLITDGKRRVVCTINESEEFQRALLPHGNGSFVITVNKELRDTLGLSFGMKVRVSVQKDESAYGLPVAEEFEELLRQDSEGNKFFHALTRGRQRTLLFIVGQVKDPEKRALRAAIVVRHLKSNNGKVNYRQLNALLRHR